jgi:hypothetical protein
MSRHVSQSANNSATLNPAILNKMWEHELTSKELLRFLWVHVEGWRCVQLEAQMQFSGAALKNIAFGDFNRQIPARRLALVYLPLPLPSLLNDSIMQVTGERSVRSMVRMVK